MQIYSQNDQRWKNNKIGYDTGPNDTIGNYGCYMTAIANVCSWAGNELTPQQINDLCKQNGWLVSSDLIGRDDVPSLLCSNLQFVGKTTWHDVTSMNFFDDASDPNIAYIICIDASKAAGIQTHFVMVWATLGGGDLEINDSWDGVRKALSHYGNPGVIIQSATKFIKTSPPPAAPAPVAVPEPEPAPVIPPPPPPAAPVTATPAETYTLVQKIPTYPTYVDALARTSVGGPLYQGIYYVWGTNGRAKQLGPDNMHEPTGNWVNTDDNIITVPDSTRLDPPPMDTPAPNPVGEPPATANWRGTINLAFAGMYVFWNHNHTHDPHALTVKVLDLETGQPVTKDGLALTPDNGQYAQFSGKVQWTDGNWYGRLKDISSQFKWYAVPIEDLLPYNDVYGSRTTLEEREYLHTLTAADKIELWLAKVGTLGRNIFDIVKPKEKKK